MTDEALALPQDWKVTPLEELARFETGRTPARANSRYWAIDGNKGLPWVSIADMILYGEIQNTKERITPVALSETFRGRISHKGTLLMSFKLTIGRVSTLGVDACHNEAIISIFPSVRINQKYLEYFLSQVNYADYQDRAVKGHTLNQEKINRIQIAEPEKREQEKIAAVLWKVQRAIEVEEKLIATVRELKQSAMHQLFTRGLRGEAQKETDIGPIPKSWNPRTILELCEIWSGGTPRKSVAEYWSGNVPWVSGKDLKRPALGDAIDHISTAGVESGSRLAPQGAVLLLVRGMGLAKDLPVAVINRPMAFNQDVKALVSRGEYSGEFLRSAIYEGKGRLLSRIVPSAHGTMTLNLDDVENLKIACPSHPDEASEIASISRALDSKISLHERRRAVLQELFQTLLHQLMTGAIRVADLDIDVSEVTA